MAAKLYRVKDGYTGLKYCFTRNPVSSDYLYSGTLRANSPDQVFTSPYSPRLSQPDRNAAPLKPGDIIVIDSLAYMWLKSGWILVNFIEKAAGV